MSGAVTSIYICPKCESPLSSPEKPTKCPKCQHRFSSPDGDLATELKWPKAPVRQLFEIVQVEVDKAIPKSARELLPIKHEGDKNSQLNENMVLSNKQKHTIIKNKWLRKRDEYFFNTHPDDIEELMQDLILLTRRSVSSGNMLLIKKCQVWAQQFADINEYLKPFIKHGAIYDRADKPSKSGDN